MSQTESQVLTEQVKVSPIEQIWLSLDLDVGRKSLLIRRL